MRCPHLSELPPPPLDNTGWPWTEESTQLPALMPDGSEWPRISIVTPNYNYGHFIEETIRSVLLQGYPNLDYIIIDGGSTDDSVEIIKKYEKYLSCWISEPDNGQSNAINKGFERATGHYVAWMNSDDCYLVNAFGGIAEILATHNFKLIYGGTGYLGSSFNEKVLEEDKQTRCLSIKNLLRFFYSMDYVIPSQSLFVSKDLMTKVGLLNEDLHYCMDLDWLVRISMQSPTSYRNPLPIFFYRLHDQAKTSSFYNPMQAEAIQIAYDYLQYLSLKERLKLVKLISYQKAFTEYTQGQRENTFSNLFETILEVPLESLRDTRFLGLIKRAYF